MEDESNDSLPPIFRSFYSKYDIVACVGGKEKLKGSCNKCSKIVMADWKPTKVTSNFVSHVKICTPVLYKNFMQNKSQKRKVSDAALAPPLKKHLVARASSTQPNSEAITDALVQYLVVSMRPVSEVENKGFRNLLSVARPDYKVPCRKTVRGKIINSCESVVETIKAEVSQAQFCAGQTDIWSSRRMHGYFGMCISYIVDGDLKTRVISCERFKGRHTAENIAAVYSTIASEYALERKLVGMVTDNAANMVKAFAYEECGTDDEQRDWHTEAIDWGAVEQETPLPVPKRYSCIAHSLQLTVADGLKEAARSITLVLQKCSRIVASIHMSCKATELLEEEAGCKILSPNATRWNSQYRMLSSILKISHEHPELMNKVADILGSSVKFTQTDKDTIKELHALLQPFTTVTERLEGEVMVTSSQVLPNIFGLQHKTKLTNTHYCTSVKTGLLVSMDKRFSGIAEDPHFIVSAVLEPQFQLRWARSTEEEHAARCTVMALSSHIQLESPAEPSSAEESTTSDDLLSYMRTTHGSSQTTNELDAYLVLSSSESSLTFWKTNGDRFPRLYQLHLKHHCIPATSAAMECAFSAAGYIVSDRRNRLDDDIIQKMLIAKCNSDIFA